MTNYLKWLIIYDIRDNRRLTKVAKIMESYGVRVQKSVFEAEGTVTSISRAKSEVKRVLKEEDSFIVIQLCPKCWQKRRQIGKKTNGIPNEDKSFMII